MRTTAYLFTFIMIIFIDSSSSNGQSLDWEWAVQAGGNTQELSTDLACDSLGNSYITGYFQMSASFGSTILSGFGSEDIFVAKYNTSGEVEWAKKAGSPIGSSDGERGRGVAVDKMGNVYVTGSFLSDAVFDSDTIHSKGSWDVFIAKYNPEGEVIWAKNAGGTNHDHGNAIAVDNEGNVFVTGTFKYDAYFDSDSLHSDWGGQEVFFAKYDPDGGLIWVKKIAGPFNPLSTAICVDNNSDVYVTGTFGPKIIFDAAFQFENVPGIDRIFLTKFSSAGVFQWAEMAGGIDPDYSSGIQTDDEGNVYLTGHFRRTAYFGHDTITAVNPDTYNADIFVAKYTTNGSYLWVKQIEPTIGTSKSLTIDRQSNIYITGFFTDSLLIEDKIFYSHGDEDIFVAEYDSSGHYLWTKHVGGPSTGEQGTGIANDGMGNLYVTGVFRSIVDFEPAGILDTGGGDKIFVAKLGNAGLSIDGGEGVTSSFRLEQNYPNPFNPETRINFYLPQAGYATLVIYDVLGRKVMTLINDFIVGGSHVILLEGSGLASGIYYYRLNVDDNFVDTKKMVLLR